MRRLRRIEAPTRYIKPLTEDERIGQFGEELYEAVAALRTGWKSIKNEALNKAGIDINFRLEDASIDTQIRTSTFGKTPGEEKGWAFRMYPTGGKIDAKLYGQPNFFLALIGLHCGHRELLDSDVPFSVPMWIRTIPGARVIERNPPHNIKISREKFEAREYEWLEGTKGIKETFAEEFERKMGREQPEPET